MITNFGTCELGATYQVNGKELIIARISTKTSGKCTHNLYYGTIDGEPFGELNSPKLKRLLGVNTLQPKTTRAKRKQKQNYAGLKAIKKARIKRLNEYINSYDSKIVDVMKTDMTAAQMMMLNKEERIERARYWAKPTSN